MANNEHQFESDIEALMTGELGWTKSSETSYLKTRDKALDLATLVKFVKASQPKEWAFFVKACSGLDPEGEFYKKFEDAVATEGMIDILRNGFYANGKHFAVCYFKPENRLNETALVNYEKNICEFHRQWHYSASETAKSVDVMLSVNGIPLVAIELKDQFTGQTVENAKVQWMTDRNPKEGTFRLNHRVLVFFAVDLNEAWMTTQLAGEETRFLPFNQGLIAAAAPMDATVDIGENIYFAKINKPVNTSTSVPIFYAAGEQTPLAELPYQEQKCINRMAYALKLNCAQKEYKVKLEEKDTWQNKFWGIDGDYISAVTDPVRKGKLTFQFFNRADGKCWNVFASIDNQGHECRPHTCEYAWRFLSCFSRGADGVIQGGEIGEIKKALE